jgi:nucleotide-binding universal stress UspA family protein
MDSQDTTRVVVGVDNTLAGLQALRRAVAEARAREVPLHALRAWTPGQLGFYPTLADQRQAEAATASQFVAAAFAETMGGLPRDVPVQTLLVGDSPGPALVRYAYRDGDLLVLGSPRRGRWHPWSRSRVVRYCLAHAACPVLVVPPPALARDGSDRALLRELRRDLEQLAGNGPGAGPDRIGGHP